MEMVNTSFILKPLSIEEPTSYLWADMGKLYYEDDSYTWNMEYKTYVDKAINNLRN